MVTKHVCRTCHKRRAAEWYVRNKEKVLSRVRQYNQSESVQLKRTQDRAHRMAKQEMLQVLLQTISMARIEQLLQYPGGQASS